MKALLFALTLLCSNAALHAEIIETAHPAAIEWAISSMPEGSLLIFDVGEVLLTRKDALLHRKYNAWIEQWANREAPEVTEKEWRSLQGIINKKADMKLVNPALLKAISNGQAKGKVIALSKYWSGKTGDGTTFEEQRLASLRAAGIDFGEPFPCIAGWHSEQQQASYGCGLILTEASLKGDVLIAFLQAARWQPKAIVFVDDRRDQCESIAAATKKLQIPALCIHYTEAVDSTPALDPTVAKLQMRTLVREKRWLADEEARNLLEANRLSSARIE